MTEKGKMLAIGLKTKQRNRLADQAVELAAAEAAATFRAVVRGICDATKGIKLNDCRFRATKRNANSIMFNGVSYSR
jgi:hypothetical protein